MLESTLATMGWVVSNWLIAGVRPAPQGNENVTSAPSGTFQTLDGPLNIAANKQQQWELLCRHLGREDLLSHPDFRRREDRKRNRLALKAELETYLRQKPARQWSQELNRLGVPAGPVLGVPEILEHPQIAARGMLGHFAAVPGVGRDIALLRTGIKLDGEAPAVDSPPPRLGQHNDEIWSELGLSPADIEALRTEEVI